MSRKFEDLLALQARLLDPNGCPWDREQTHESLRTYLLEETYEVLEALDARDFSKFPEELGDLLLQIVFHAELAKRAGRFEMGDVIESIYTKMVRRHPHVFGDTEAEDSRTVLRNWEQLKAEERKAAGKLEKADSLLDGIPKTLPATLEAYQLTRRASRIGFDWEALEGILEKLQEEVRELRAAVESGAREKIEGEIGDLLFVAVNVARFLETDPELALRATNHKFQERFRWMEQEAARTGRKLAEVSRQEMETLWDRAKQSGSPAAEGRE